jgi:exonuclease 1
MGIAGLLPLIMAMCERRHISGYRSKRIGIDGHAWLHQILPSVGEQVLFGVPTTKYVDMFESRIRTLLDYGVIPVVVLDGDALPSKRTTNDKRRERRRKAMEEIESCILKGKLGKASGLINQCISVSREIIHNIARMLEKRGVEYIIAPYEADAQLCYLQKTGYIDAILTEDSDLIPYGANKVLYKFDQNYVREFNQECLEKARDTRFKEKILDICVLSGCDYLESIRGVGIVMAHRLLSAKDSVEEVIEDLRNIRNVPENYAEEFRRARKTFLHQIVYDPVGGCRRHLNDTGEVLPFLGTLEDVGYIIENDRNGNSQLEEFLQPMNEARTLERHFCPRKRESETQAEEEMPMPVGADESLCSPYFKE